MSQNSVLHYNAILVAYHWCKKGRVEDPCGTTALTRGHFDDWPLRATLWCLLYGGRELTYDFFFYYFTSYFLLFLFYFFTFCILFIFVAFILFSFCFYLVHFYFLIFVIVFFFFCIELFFILFRFLTWNEMETTWPRADIAPKINHDGRGLAHACTAAVC